jgi:hypothetical protein
MKKRSFLLAATCSLALSIPVPAAEAQKIGQVDTSQWHGFNLLEMLTLFQQYMKD